MKTRGNEMTNKQFAQFIETIIIMLETTKDVDKVIEYLKRIQKKE